MFELLWIVGLFGSIWFKNVKNYFKNTLDYFSTTRLGSMNIDRRLEGFERPVAEWTLFDSLL